MKDLSQRLKTIAALVPNGARACDIGCDHGYLAIYLRLNNIAKNVVYAGSKQNVRRTVVDGKILYDSGEYFIGDSPETIYKKANEIINEMK